MSYKTTKRIVQAATFSSLLSTAAYAVTIPGSGSGSAEQKIPYTDIVMPEHLTQQTDDFYRNPEKDFDYYQSLFAVLSDDGVIDFKDAETLEFILSRTIEEIEHKPAQASVSVDWAKYNVYVSARKKDLQKLRNYIDDCNYWRELPERIWHPGLDVIHIEGKRDSAHALKDLFRNSAFYKTNPVPGVLYTHHQSKQDGKWWLGLVLGLIIPGLTSYASCRIRKKEFEGPSIGYMFGSSLCGLTLTDGLHPLAYPARLIAVPLVIEAGRYIFGKKEETPKVEQQVEEPEEEIKPAKIKLTDPWEVDIPEIEDSRR